VLCGDVDLLLADGTCVVEVADWESDEEREMAVKLAIESRSGRMETPPRFGGWKAVVAPEATETDAPVFLELVCVAGDVPPKLWLDVQSRHELWRPWSIDHDGPVPGGCQNLERLRQAMEKVAAATSGTVSVPLEIQTELDRANGLR
jgi:hypothetical protein